MNTAFDWLSVGAVSAIIALFAQRHTAAQPDGIPLIHYVVPAAAMALMNILGNAGETIAAIAIGAGGIGYAMHFLRLRSDPLP